MSASAVVVEKTMLSSISEQINAFPAFPYLWVPHCVIMSLALRTTLGADGWKSFSRRHPLSCFMLAVMYTFPGGILAAALMGEPVLAFTLNTPFVAAMAAAWYLVFYSPSDVFVSVVDSLRLRVPMGAMQDFLRIHLVVSGVQTVHATHPGSVLYPVVFAVCKSSGFMFLKYAEHVLVSGGVQKAFVIPHHSTKTCIVASAAFTAHSLGHFPAAVGVDALFAVLVAVAVLLRLLTALTDLDPYAPFERLVCLVLFGGAADDESKDATAKPGTKSKVAGGARKCSTCVSHLFRSLSLFQARHPKSE